MSYFKVVREGYEKWGPDSRLIGGMLYEIVILSPGKRLGKQTLTIR